MEHKISDEMMREIENFNLPKYNEIPNVGLFLEQVTKYISEYVSPLDEVTLTASMISNYVKKDILRNPVKKQYDRDQIAILFFIAVAKSVLALEDIQLLLRLQRETYSTEKAYEYFRVELKEVLLHVFGMKEELSLYTAKNQDEKSLLRNTVITVAHKVYLEKYFAAVRGGEQ